MAIRNEDVLTIVDDQMAGGHTLDEVSNVTTVIARAADVGYRIVVVLSDPEQAARQAIQARLERDVLALNRERWFVLTGPGAGSDADFRAGWHNFPDEMLADLPTKRILIVVRKDAAALSELTTWFEGVNPRLLTEAPVLFVDADHGGRAETSPQVREVLDDLSKRTHVGHVDVARVNGLH